MASEFGIDAQIIGRVEVSETRQLTIQSEFGTFIYTA
jgi:phosphoribosylformylglycinamidine cyclo-ligase